MFSKPFDEWFYKALVLLVISCPCALAISTPVSMVSGITGAARNGVLIKGGNYIEEMAKAKVFVFDKTGTLTEGKPRHSDALDGCGIWRYGPFSACDSECDAAGGVKAQAFLGHISSIEKLPLNNWFEE